MKFGLTEKEWNILDQTLIRPLLKEQNAKVWIFGSRARGDYKKFSDIDILFSLSEGKKLPQGFLSQIKENLDNSSLPYKVDIVDIKELAQSYQSFVDADKIELL